MPKRDVIVMAASAGGIETLQVVLGGLPAELEAAVLVVLHMPAAGGRELPRILDRSTPLTVGPATDGEVIRAGRVYCCVGDHHLLVSDGHLHLRRGPRENGHRPAADPLLRSAAAHLGPRVIGVILSGTLSDGVAGLATVRQRGGLAVVQDPADAAFDGMPSSALEHVGADRVVTAAAMGAVLAELVGQRGTEPEGSISSDVAKEVALMDDGVGATGRSHPGVASSWPCPDCSGVLWEVDDEPVLRFRCRVGHAWSAESLLHEQAEGVEGALWVALRALEDRAALAARLADQAESSGRRFTAERLRSDLVDMERSLRILHELMEGPPAVSSRQEGSADG